jgi:acyl dehydratase
MTVILRHSFTQHNLDDFGRLSGGDGRIHTDPDYAAGTLFGHTVVQGMLLVALVEQAVSTVLPDGRTGAHLDVTFVAPVGVGQEIAIHQIHHTTTPDPQFEATTDAGVVLVATLSREGRP